VCTSKVNDNNSCMATGCESFVIDTVGTACAHCNTTSCAANQYCD